MDFEKIQFFAQNLRLQFYHKKSVWGKNRPKLRISLSCPPYYDSFIHNSLVYEFLWVLKKIQIFAQNP
jgi:hypothetical protein